MELVNLNNYAAVRNICALAGICNGSRYTIFIDDDEVFTDPDFLKKIEENWAWGSTNGLSSCVLGLNRACYCNRIVLDKVVFINGLHMDTAFFTQDRLPLLTILFFRTLHGPA